MRNDDSFSSLRLERVSKLATFVFTRKCQKCLNFVYQSSFDLMVFQPYLRLVLTF